MAKFSLAGTLDAWLIKRGLEQPLIIAVVRNQILLLLLLLFVATSLTYKTLWAIWFSLGFGVMTIILYSWAMFFSKTQLDSYGAVFFKAFFLRFLLRLGIVAALLFVSIAYAHADVIAIVIGTAVGTFAPLLTLVLEKFTTK